MRQKLALEVSAPLELRTRLNYQLGSAFVLVLAIEDVTVPLCSTQAEGMICGSEAATSGPTMYPSLAAAAYAAAMPRISRLGDSCYEIALGRSLPAVPMVEAETSSAETSHGVLGPAGTEIGTYACYTVSRPVYRATGITLTSSREHRSYHGPCLFVETLGAQCDREIEWGYVS